MHAAQGLLHRGEVQFSVQANRSRLLQGKTLAWRKLGIAWSCFSYPLMLTWQSRKKKHHDVVTTGRPPRGSARTPTLSIGRPTPTSSRLSSGPGIRSRCDNPSQALAMWLEILAGDGQSSVFRNSLLNFQNTRGQLPVEVYHARTCATVAQVAHILNKNVICMPIQ